MTSFIDYLKEEDSMRSRFVDWAFKEKRDIKDFSDFVDALKNAFNTSNGTKALRHLNDTESKFLFESPECREKIAKNLSDEEYHKMYDAVERGDWDVERKVPKGEPTKASDINVIYAPKNIYVKSYMRGERRTKPYQKTNLRWTSAQAKFIEVRKAKGLPTRTIVNDYNAHFKENKRTESSIRTKTLRL